jgi:hypothetical protein
MPSKDKIDTLENPISLPTPPTHLPQDIAPIQHINLAPRRISDTRSTRQILGPRFLWIDLEEQTHIP